MSLTIGALNELIKELAPGEYNSIIIDNAVEPKCYNYCYLHVMVQKLDFRSDSVSFAADKCLAQELLALNTQQNGNLYIPIDKGLIDRAKKAPRSSGEGIIGSAKRIVSELMNGGREVDLNHLELVTDGDRLSKNQPPYAVKEECGVTYCRACKGSGSIENVDKQGVITKETCNVCEGFGNLGKLTWFTATVNEKEASLVVCRDGEIPNMKSSVIESHRDKEMAHKRMRTHFNGMKVDEYDVAVRPYLDAIHDKVGNGNAIEDIYFRIVPCYLFSYRIVVTGGIHSGVLVDPAQRPELILSLESAGHNALKGMSNSIKNISHFFGGLGRTDAFKDKEDLRHTVRLLIAVAVADGQVTEEEKQTLTLAIRDINTLTTTEQDDMVKLLGSADSSFLNDDDFTFHVHENQERTLARLQEIAAADGSVHDTERDIIERLRFRY